MWVDLVKRDRMQAASEHLRAADVALRYLSAESSDLGQGAIANVEAGGNLQRPPSASAPASCAGEVRFAS